MVLTKSYISVMLRCFTKGLQKVKVLSGSVIYESFRSHGLEPARLLCPWISPGKNTGEGCHFLLQWIASDPGIKPISLAAPVLAGRFFTSWATSLAYISKYMYLGKVAQSCLFVTPWTDCSPPGSSVHGFLQARILEWVAIPFSRGSSQPRDWTQVSSIAGGFFTILATRE